MTAYVLDTEASGLDMPHAAEIAYKRYLPAF